MKKFLPKFFVQKIILSTILFSIITLGLVGVSYPQSAYADMPVLKTADSPQETTKTIWEKLEKSLASASAVAFRNALSAFLSKFAYDAATWLASGDKGEQALIFTTDSGTYVGQLADAAAGAAIEGFATELGFDAAGLCQPTDPLFPINLGLGLEGLQNLSPYEPVCTFSEFKDNWDEFLTDPDFDSFVEAQWDPAANPIGQALSAMSYVASQTEQAKDDATMERLTSSFKDVTETVSDYVLTPGVMVEQQIEDAGDNASFALQYMGQPAADALSVFTNTLLSKFSDRIKEGFVQFYAGTEVDELVSGSTGGSTAGVAAAEAVYASLSEPNFMTTGEQDILSMLANCDLEDGEGATSENCLIGSTLQSAIENKWTLREFVEYAEEVEGRDIRFIETDSYPFTVDNTAKGGISYQAVIVLKKYRIAPVGWQLAAELIQSELGAQFGAVTLRDVMDCYETCGSEDDIGDCTLFYKDENDNNLDGSPFCGLVDPDWVLKMHEHYCEREAPGPYVVYDEPYDDDGVDDTQELRQVSRLDYCADSRGCIEEETEGYCSAYGYCYQDKDVYRMKGDTCDAASSSCQSFEKVGGEDDGNEVSYLKNTLNYGDCASDPGCTWYCLDDNCKNQDTIYDTCDETDSTYFTQESCTCTVEETCWVDAGSGGAEPDTYRTCTLDSGETCDLGDNCGASHVNYNSDLDQCLCSTSNTCDIDIDTDDSADPEDETTWSLSNTCEYTYDDSTTVECTLPDGEYCEPGYDTYSSYGYCTADNLGDSCAVQPGETSCINDVGNSCELYKCYNNGGDLESTLDYQECADENFTWSLTSCNSSFADIDGTYCSCDPADNTSSDSSCNVTESYDSCTDDNGNNIILGTENEADRTPEDIDLVYNASLNLDNNLESCSEDDASCHEYIRILDNTNLLRNASFETIQDDAANTINDNYQDYFAFYSLSTDPCKQSSEEEGDCIGWQQHGDAILYASTDDSSYYSIRNDFETSAVLTIDSSSTLDDTDKITNSFDTGYPLAGRTFTFAYRAMAPGDESTPKFSIGDSGCEDFSTGYCSYGVMVSGNTAIDQDGNEISINSDNYDYFDEYGNITDYTSEYTDYYYTLTFPDDLYDSETTVMLTIFATGEPVSIDIAEITESSSWDGTYSDYGINNVAYLKKDYVECETDDIGCDLYTPLDQDNATAIPGQITNPYSDACGNGSDFSNISCNQCDGSSSQGADYYVGCDFYQEMPLENNVIDYYLGSFNTQELQGITYRTGYYCLDSDTPCFDSDDSGSICSAAGLGACQNNISLIPSTAEDCSAAEVGCEEFTNLDAVSAGGEGLAYYSYTRACVKPTDENIYTYHSWEGSDTEGYGMVLHNFKKSNLDGAPCTHLDIASESSEADCLDSNDSSSAFYVEDCEIVYGEDPDCVKYYDDDLNVYYRYASQTISVSEDCLPLRSSLDQIVYYSIPSESTTCSASAVGCREYQGSGSADIEQLINETFNENSTEDWVGALTTSNESLFTDDYSLRIDSGSSDDDEDFGGSGDASEAGDEIYYNLYTTNTDEISGETNYLSNIEGGATYTINFWAKGNGSLNLFLGGFCTNNDVAISSSVCSGDGDWIGLNNNYYFTENGYSNEYSTINLNSAGASTGSEIWEYHILGPIYLPTTENAEAAVLRLGYQGNTEDAKAYIDNIILEKSDKQYLINYIENNGSYDVNFDICPDFEGCKSYGDTDNNTHYLKSFKRLCEDAAVGCENMIDTANSSETEFSEIFLTTNEYSADDITIPYDQAQPIIYNEDYECSSLDKGCTHLYEPDINEQTDVVNSFSDVYGIVDPDNMESLTCEDAQLSCQEYYSGYDGTSYFKDPGDKYCQYQSYSSDTGTEYGWFKKDSESSSPDCPLQYDYYSDSQPYGSVCNSNSKEKAGKKCNNDADCVPADWQDGYPQYRCISRIEDDVDQWDCTGTECAEDHFADDGYSVDPNLAFGWIGECSAQDSGCTEYIDPNSPLLANLIKNGSFEDNVKNNITALSFDQSGLEEELPDYWKPYSDYYGNNVYEGDVYDDGWLTEGQVDADGESLEGVAADGEDSGANDGEDFKQDATVKQEGIYSLKMEQNMDLINSDPIIIERDNLYNVELYLKISSSAYYDGEDDDFYKKFKIGALFEDYNDETGASIEIDASDDQKYFIANDLTIDSSHYEEDTQHSGYGQWMRLSGEIGVGSDIEIPEDTEKMTIFLGVSSEGTAPSEDADYVWIDDISVKEADSYYMLDYTVDGTEERESFDGVHTCIDQDTEEEAVNSDGSCVAFRDTMSDTQDYEQLGDECTACAITPNSDSCRYIADACDTNAVFAVTRDRICDEYLGCVTAEKQTDDQGNESYVCIELKPCEDVGPGGTCAKWGDKPTASEMGTGVSSVMQYTVNNGDADQLYAIQDLTGYVKVSLTWEYYTVCDSGPYEGELCFGEDDNCLDRGTCTDEGYCENDLNTMCTGDTNGDGFDDACDLANSLLETPTCLSAFSTEGYYPYGWMHEGGETASDGNDLIENGNFEVLYCQGKGINNDDIPCVLNSYDERADTMDSPFYGQCWQSEFDAYLDDDDDSNQPIEGNPDGNTITCTDSAPCDDVPSNADYFCPNSPDFKQFPFSDWHDEPEDSSAKIFVTQYDPYFSPDNPDNLKVDYNNVLQVSPTASYQGIRYDLGDNIDQDKSYALSFKARYTETPNDLDDNVENPSLASIGFRHNNIITYDATGTETDTDNWDWFVQGGGGADIVFIVDSSMSMEPTIDALNQAIPDFANSLNTQGVDFSFAVVGMTQDETINSDLDLAKWTNYNRLIQDFTSGSSDVQSALHLLATERATPADEGYLGYLYVDPANAITQVINGTLDDGAHLSYRDYANKYIILVTDTGDEVNSDCHMADGGACGADNDIDMEDAEALVAATETPVIVASVDPITSFGGSSDFDGSYCSERLGKTCSDYYNILVDNSDGFYVGAIYVDVDSAIADGAELEDWPDYLTAYADWDDITVNYNNINMPLDEAITTKIIDQLDYFQYSTDWETYTLGPITIAEKDLDDNEFKESGQSITTDLVFITNDTFSVQYDDVSLLPVLDVSDDKTVARSCRAYSDAQDIECNYMEANGIQHNGWLGYCLETDPNNPNYCLTWWPLDSITGETVFNIKIDNGYSDRINVQHCLVAKGYERVGFCDDDSAAGEGISCQPSSWTDENGYSQNCPNVLDRCHYGSISHIYPSGDPDTIEEPSHFEDFAQSAGSCSKQEDASEDCAAWPSEAPYCEDIRCDNEEDCIDDWGGCGSAWYDDDGTINLYDQLDDEGVMVGDSVDDFSFATCQDFENNGETFCAYDLDGDEISEIISEIPCSSSSECTNLERAELDLSELEAGEYNCYPTLCSQSLSMECEWEHEDVGGDAIDSCTLDFGDSSLEAFTGNYHNRIAEWYLHDPYDTAISPYGSGVITRIPASPVAKNVNYNELERIDLFTGYAGDGCGYADESLFLGQGTNGNSVTLTNLDEGAIYYNEDTEQLEAWRDESKCRALHSQEMSGVGCEWWGQYDSQGTFLMNDSQALDPTDLDSAPHGYDLVYVWGLSRFTRYIDCTDSSGEEHTCKHIADDDLANWRIDSLNELSGDDREAILSSCCVEDYVKEMMYWDDIDHESNYTGAVENNPWEYITDDMKDEIGYSTDSAKTITFERSELVDEGSPIFAWMDADDLNIGGAIYSIWLDFDEAGYLQAIYTLLFDAADDLHDSKYGLEATREAPISLDYYLREPCALAVTTVDEEGNNIAWAERSSGYSTPDNFSAFSYGTENVPWGSISPMESVDEVKYWDSIDEYSTEDEGNVNIATNYGQQPVFFLDVDGNEANGGQPYTCIGQCAAKYCTGPEEELFDECDNDCGTNSSSCIGIGDDTAYIDSIGYSNAHEYANYQEQLAAVASTAQDRLKHVFASIPDENAVYQVNFNNYHQPEGDSIYTNNSDLWDASVFESMPLCDDGSGTDDSNVRTGDIGEEEEYCGVRPEVQNIKINDTGTDDVQIGNDESITLTFDSVVNDEQENLQDIIINWGDGNIVPLTWDSGSSAHSYTHGYSCNDKEDSVAFPSYFDASEDDGYCVFKGNITLIDNWGWCSGESLGTCVRDKPTWEYYVVTQDECLDYADESYGDGFDDYPTFWLGSAYDYNAICSGVDKYNCPMGNRYDCYTTGECDPTDDNDGDGSVDEGNDYSYTDYRDLDSDSNYDSQGDTSYEHCGSYTSFPVKIRVPYE